MERRDRPIACALKAPHEGAAVRWLGPGRCGYESPAALYEHWKALAEALTAQGFGNAELREESGPEGATLVLVLDAWTRLCAGWHGKERPWPEGPSLRHLFMRVERRVDTRWTYEVRLCAPELVEFAVARELFVGAAASAPEPRRLPAQTPPGFRRWCERLAKDRGAEREARGSVLDRLGLEAERLIGKLPLAGAARPEDRRFERMVVDDTALFFETRFMDVGRFVARSYWVLSPPSLGGAVVGLREDLLTTGEVVLRETFVSDERAAALVALWEWAALLTTDGFYDDWPPVAFQHLGVRFMTP